MPGSSTLRRAAVDPRQLEAAAHAVAAGLELADELAWSASSPGRVREAVLASHVPPQQRDVGAPACRAGTRRRGRARTPRRRRACGAAPGSGRRRRRASAARRRSSPRPRRRRRGARGRRPRSGGAVPGGSRAPVAVTAVRPGGEGELPGHGAVLEAHVDPARTRSASVRRPRRRRQHRHLDLGPDGAGVAHELDLRRALAHAPGGEDRSAGSNACPASAVLQRPPGRPVGRSTCPARPDAARRRAPPRRSRRRPRRRGRASRARASATHEVAPPVRDSTTRIDVRRPPASRRRSAPSRS